MILIPIKSAFEFTSTIIGIFGGNSQICKDNSICGSTISKMDAEYRIANFDGFRVHNKFVCGGGTKCIQFLGEHTIEFTLVSNVDDGIK
jgi:diaminopimelate epimerase